ncbi:amino acid ABC transporter permease [Streptomyces sp. NPDC059063]|uniref:amino acid ABC transporter permease n=1 Tax=unclassified Streptomyces TaxID=2593676 RepID=UPI0036D01FC0
MAWDEWEQLKAEAVARQSTQMQLNEAPDGGGSTDKGGSGTGSLKHTRKPWTHAANVADELGTGTRRARAALHSAHGGVESGAEGLASLGALKAVLTSWERRMSAVRNECESLEPKLRRTARELGEVDVKVGAETDAVQVPGTRRGE